MSDDPKVEGSGTRKDPYREPTKTIKVSVEGGKTEVDRITAERDELKKVLEDLAEKELEEKKDEVKRLIPETEHETIDKMGGFELNGYITGLEKSRGKKISSGIIRLRELGNDPEEYEESPKGRKKWAHFIMNAKNDPNNPYYAEVNELFKQARNDPDLLKYIPRNIDFSEVTTPAVRDLGEKFTFKEYTEWIQKKAKEKAHVK